MQICMKESNSIKLVKANRLFPFDNNEEKKKRVEIRIKDIYV
jgi:hypothetical protein